MMVVADPAVSTSTIELPQTLRNLFASIREAVPDAVLVGGSVRDLLLGRTPYDIDVVTRRDAHEAAEALGAALAGHVFALDEPRRQYRVVLDEAAALQVDVSQIEDVETDLRRRDFRLNAIAAPIEADGSLGALIDPLGGAEDVEARRLRMVSAATLRDDPLRLLRAVRLAVELDLSIEDETADTIRELAPLLPSTAAERQRDELVRVLATSRAAGGVRMADELGLLAQLLPELMPARGVSQPITHHYYDVFDHSIETLAALDEMLAEKPSATSLPWLGPAFREELGGFDLEAYLAAVTGGQKRLVLLKLAGLLHDVSKPETKTLEADGRTRFFRHAEKGSDKALAICERLRFGNREGRFVAKLVEEHLRPTQLSQGGLPTRRALYRFFRDLGDAAPACLILSLADAAAATGPRLQEERWRGYVAYIAYVLAEGAAQGEATSETRRRLVDGDELMAALALEPGPLIGRMLAVLDEAQALGDVTSRDEALALARSVLNEDDVQVESGTEGEG
jgi:tRNA nucleotidyltransferase/poly(A) polymerase